MNKYEQELEDRKKDLLICQKSKNISDCLKCDEVNKCKIRGDYVTAVYKSMNKGDEGGFEF